MIRPSTKTLLSIFGGGGGALRDIPKTAAEDTTVPALMVIDRISNFWSVYK